MFCVVRLSLGRDGSNFEQQASSAVLDLMGDEGDRLNQHKALMKWWLFKRPLTHTASDWTISCCHFLPFYHRDRKKKRFVRESGKEDKKKIKTESGQIVGNKNRKNLYPSGKMPVSLFCFIEHVYNLFVLFEPLCHLTSCQLWGVEEEIQSWRCWVWFRWRNRRRKEEVSRRYDNNAQHNNE